MLTQKTRLFIRQQRVAITGLLLSLFCTLSVAVLLLPDAIYFNDPRHQNEPLKPWMTPRYVGLSYDLPRSIVLEIFNLSEDQTHPRRLDRIASNLGITLEALTRLVETEADEYHRASDD